MERPESNSPALHHSVTQGFGSLQQPVAESPQLLHVRQGMQTRPLLIITTRLPPQICGIGTFSWMLERHWVGDRSQHRFLVVENGAHSGVQTGPKVSEFGSDWAALGKVLDQAGSADVLLHYAGRGYHRYGCPLGLSGVVQQWKRKFPTARVFIFFHELPGRLPIFSKHYWLNICNRRIVRQLASHADLVITNTQEHVRTLEKLSHHRNIPCLPVPSNIENVGTEASKRERTEFVIFGLPYGRWQTLQTFDHDIRAWQQRGALTKLHLIGPTDNKFDLRSEALIGSYPAPNVVVRHGEVAGEQISRLLSTARFALTTADELTWSKSTTLMAFLEHGCVAVAKSRFEFEPLLFSITADQVTSISDDELQAQSDAGREWYAANADWKVLAGKISELISNLPLRDS